jgi:hypothetical protein
MWIFITAVFLVTVWLLYRWPKRTLQAFAVILGVVALGVWWFVDQQSGGNPKWEAFGVFGGHAMRCSVLSGSSAIDPRIPLGNPRAWRVFSRLL